MREERNSEKTDKEETTNKDIEMQNFTIKNKYEAKSKEFEKLWDKYSDIYHAFPEKNDKHFNKDVESIMALIPVKNKIEQLKEDQLQEVKEDDLTNLEGAIESLQSFNKKYLTIMENSNVPTNTSQPLAGPQPSEEVTDETPPRNERLKGLADRTQHILDTNTEAVNETEASVTTHLKNFETNVNKKIEKFVSEFTPDNSSFESDDSIPPESDSNILTKNSQSPGSTPNLEKQREDIQGQKKAQSDLNAEKLDALYNQRVNLIGEATALNSAYGGSTNILQNQIMQFNLSNGTLFNSSKAIKEADINKLIETTELETNLFKKKLELTKLLKEYKEIKEKLNDITKNLQTNNFVQTVTLNLRVDELEEIIKAEMSIDTNEAAIAELTNKIDETTAAIESATEFLEKTIPQPVAETVVAETAAGGKEVPADEQPVVTEPATPQPALTSTASAQKPDKNVLHLNKYFEKMMERANYYSVNLAKLTMSEGKKTKAEEEQFTKFQKASDEMITSLKAYIEDKKMQEFYPTRIVDASTQLSLLEEALALALTKPDAEKGIMQFSEGALVAERNHEDIAKAIRTLNALYPTKPSNSPSSVIGLAQEQSSFPSTAKFIDGARVSKTLLPAPHTPAFASKVTQIGVISVQMLNETNKRYESHIQFDKKDIKRLDADGFQKWAITEIENFRSGSPYRDKPIIINNALPDKLVTAMHAYCDAKGYAVRFTDSNYKPAEFSEESAIAYRKNLHEDKDTKYFTEPLKHLVKSHKKMDEEIKTMDAQINAPAPSNGPRR